MTQHRSERADHIGADHIGKEIVKLKPGRGAEDCVESRTSEAQCFGRGNIDSSAIYPVAPDALVDEQAHSSETTTIASSEKISM